jgi:hypothetical protein
MMLNRRATTTRLGLIALIGMTLALSGCGSAATSPSDMFPAGSGATDAPQDTPSDIDTNPPATTMPVMGAALPTVAPGQSGTVVAWGDDTGGQVDVPDGLSGVVAVAAGDEFSLALKSDGTVVAWGADDAGQTDIPAGLANVKAISAGSSFAVALKADGSIVGWGDNTDAQL